MSSDIINPFKSELFDNVNIVLDNYESSENTKYDSDIMTINELLNTVKNKVNSSLRTIDVANQMIAANEKSSSLSDIISNTCEFMYKRYITITYDIDYDKTIAKELNSTLARAWIDLQPAIIDIWDFNNSEQESYDDENEFIQTLYESQYVKLCENGEYSIHEIMVICLSKAFSYVLFNAKLTDEEEK